MMPARTPTRRAANCLSVITIGTATRLSEVEPCNPSKTLRMLGWVLLL